MAQFRGTIQGQRGEASRLGNKKTGLQVTANGWEIGVKVCLRHNRDMNRDEIEIYLTSGSNSRFNPQRLFSGTAEEVIAKLKA